MPQAQAAWQRLEDASVSPRSYGQRFELVKGIPLHICRVFLLLLRQRRGAAGNGLGITIKYLRRTTSGATGNGLGTTI
jgi:hypothetical protein